MKRTKQPGTSEKAQWSNMESAKPSEQKTNAAEYDTKILNQALVKGRISHPATPDGYTPSDGGIPNPIDAIILKNTNSLLKDRPNPLIAKQQSDRNLVSSHNDFNSSMQIYPNHVNKIEKTATF